MNEKQKTCLTEELTKEEREKLISRVRGIANIELRYQILVSETEKAIIKKVVPKKDYDKLEYDRDYWERQFNNEIDNSIKIMKNNIPKEEHDKLKETLLHYTFKAEKYEKLYREKIKDYDTANASLKYWRKQFIDLSDEITDGEYIPKEKIKKMFDDLESDAVTLIKLCPNEHHRDDYYWGWNDAGIKIQERIEEKKKQFLSEK